MSADSEVDVSVALSWNEATAEAALNMRGDPREEWRPFYCTKRGCDGLPHDVWGFAHARQDQHPPKGRWLTWAQIAGRGAGKTRSGTEWIGRVAKKNPGYRIALIAPTTGDIRDTLIEGESGILAKSAPGFVPDWEPSKKRLTWPNGSQAFGYSGEEPDRLRGRQHHVGWVDEPAHMPLIDDVWSNFLFGLRLGVDPRITVTTTPLSIPWLKKLLADEGTVTTRASTYSNLANLPPHFAKIILERYEGTRLGRQEIYGELLGDVEGALWQSHLIEDSRLEVDRAPREYDRVVVALDPAGTSVRRSDETGIVVVGMVGGEFYIIADLSGKYSPKGWADRAVSAVERYSADAIVVEVTYGREMVTSTIENATEALDIKPRIVPVDSRRGKVIRADPIVALYERKLVHHVGQLEQLEDQLTGWVPGQSSPDRLDALVHGITDLAKITRPADIGHPYHLLRNAGGRHLRRVS